MVFFFRFPVCLFSVLCVFWCQQKIQDGGNLGCGGKGIGSKEFGGGVEDIISFYTSCKMD